MVVPLAARAVAAVIGGILVITAARSVLTTIIVPRPTGSWLIRSVDKATVVVYELVVKHVGDFRTRDRVLATQAAVILILQLITWLAIFFVGFSLLLWPFIDGGITEAFNTAGPALWFIGDSHVSGAWERGIQDCAAVAGLVTITLQIAYLPTLYSAFNRRETDIALLNARAGVPSWGPELLARTHYALGSGSSTIDTLPDLYGQWERFAADITESHTTYLPLVRFRSPRPLSSWLTALLAVLDSAALIMALSPSAAPEVPARLCLRSGFICLTEIARAMGIKVPEEPDPDAGISLSYEDFEDAVARMRKVDFPIERSTKEAWPEFVGWRVNYEQAAYALAYAIDAVPALWSGPRRWPFSPISPIRPSAGKPPKEHPAKKSHSPGRQGSGARRAGTTAARRPGADGRGDGAGTPSS
jgi:hypothetical protein